MCQCPLRSGGVRECSIINYLTIYWENPNICPSIHLFSASYLGPESGALQSKHWCLNFTLPLPLPTLFNSSEGTWGDSTRRFSLSTMSRVCPRVGCHALTISSSRWQGGSLVRYLNHLTPLFFWYEGVTELHWISMDGPRHPLEKTYFSITCPQETVFTSLQTV